jgi:hypothetical protein
MACSIPVVRTHGIVQQGNTGPSHTIFKKRRPQDPRKINLSDDREMTYWRDKLKVTPEELRAAV